MTAYEASDSLSGTSFGLLGYAKLYLGEDHLLSITKLGFTERYRRLYFADIQSIVVRRTLVGAVLNIAFGLGCTLLLPALFSSSWPARIAWGIPGALSLAGLIVNLVKGPTCVTEITTAVQREPLKSLDRVRKAQEALAVLRPLIEAVQGRLAPEEPAEAGAPAPEPGLDPDAPPPPAPGGEGGEPR